MQSTEINVWTSVVVVVALVAASLILYWPGLGGGYLFDDLHVLKDNASIRLKSLDSYSLAAAADSFNAGGRQLSMLSFALNYYFFGESIWWIKFFNLLIHCLNGLGLFILTRQVTSVLSGSDLHRNQNLTPVVLATCVTALWMVHPINLTSVLYMSQRMALMATFFIVWGMVAYVWVRPKIKTRARKLVYIPLLIAGFTVVGYRCKENAILLPAYLFLIELCVFRFAGTQGRDRVIISLFSLGIILLVGGVAYKFLVDPDWITSGYRFRQFDLLERVLTQFRALTFYLSQIIVPVNSQLGLWHDDYQISRGLLEPRATLVSLLVLCGLLATALYSVRRAPLLALGLLWFFVSHSIESTVFSLELVHEHRNYLASFGILLAGIVILGRILRGKRIVLVGLTAIGFLYYGFTLHQRAIVWGDAEDHALFEAENRPESAAANYQVGLQYYVKAMEGDDASVKPALQYLEKAMQNDLYSNTPELLLFVFSQHELVDVKHEWINSAIEKIEKYPFMAPTRTAVNGVFRCLRRKNCDLPEAETRRLMEAALNANNGDLRTVGAFYFTEISPDFAKAEEGFRKSRNSRNAGRWVNWLNFLLYTEQKEKGCKQFREFKQAASRGTFKNLVLYAGQVSYLEEQFRDCSN